MIQRWDDNGPSPFGMYVLYADHVAAMIAEGGAAKNYGYQQGLDAAREAVYRTCGHTKYEGCSPCAHDDAVAAIRAREEKS